MITKKVRYLLLGVVLLGVLLNVNGFLLGLMEGTDRIVVLIEHWDLAGNKSLSAKENDAVLYLRGKNTLAVTYDLHGVCLLGNDASKIVLEQGGKPYSVSLSQYGKNCFDGEQTINIPLGHFEGFDVGKKLEKVSARFWYPTHYEISIRRVVAYTAAGNVLGDSVRPDYTKYRKTFPNITPIRTVPYASASSRLFGETGM